MDQMASIDFYDGQQCKVWREQIYNEDQAIAIDPLLNNDVGQAEELGFEEFKG